jgi:pimeloyl-ACP methyl ester carboxylesterase
VPGIVLIGGPGPQDRDETREGVPVFGLLAGALADAGFAVVRYDKRGTGQSGGRTERATMTTYTDDVLHAITWLRRRKDVDGDRLAVIGYGEGGPLAMLAADREGRIDGVVLLAAPGRTGRDLVLEQQERELAALPISDAEKAQRTALQRRIIDALTTGGNWDQVPADVRADADTPWFRSWLLFDPAEAMRDVDKPVLIVHGGADARMPPMHADALEALARARRRPPTHTRKIVVPNVTHALVEAASAAPAGEAAGGPATAASERSLAPAVTSAIVSWLREIWTDR